MFFCGELGRLDRRSIALFFAAVYLVYCRQQQPACQTTVPLRHSAFPHGDLYSSASNIDKRRHRQHQLCPNAGFALEYSCERFGIAVYVVLRRAACTPAAFAEWNWLPSSSPRGILLSTLLAVDR